MSYINLQKKFTNRNKSNKFEMRFMIKKTNQIYIIIQILVYFNTFTSNIWILIMKYLVKSMINQ